MIKAIETKYKGYRFRSRVEARWAVFFDSLGLKWEYEPEGFELGNGIRYLPDFRIQKKNVFGECYFYGEVKGTEPNQLEREKGLLLANKIDGTVAFFVGTPGDEKLKTLDPRDSKPIFAQDKRGIVEGLAFFFFYLTNMHKEDACNLVSDAIEAARSARFEYGETP